MRPGILQHQNVVRLDVELGIVDAGGEIFQRREHHRPALVLEQSGVGRRALEDGALRRQIAEQGDQAARRLKRFLRLGDNRTVDIIALVAGEPLAQRFAGHCHAVKMQQRL